MTGMKPGEQGFGYDPDSGILYDGTTGEQTRTPTPVGCQQMYYIGIRDAIRSGQAAPIPAKDAVAVMAILETSFESGVRGQVLPLPLTTEEQAEWT